MRNISAHPCGHRTCCGRSGTWRQPMKLPDVDDLDYEQGATNNLPDRGGLELDRRDFLRVLGGGLLICLKDIPAWAQESGRTFGSRELPRDVSSWLHIAADGAVKVFTGKVEVGQNIRTSLAQQVAEELRVPFDSITMVMGDTDLVPWDMGTFGSRTTPTMAPVLRTMAAAARETLIEMAARRWNVAPATLMAADGKVMNPRKSQSLSYGDLTHGEKLVKTVSNEVRLTP